MAAAMHCVAGTAGAWLPGHTAALDHATTTPPASFSPFPLSASHQTRFHSQLASVSILSHQQAFSPVEKKRKFVAAGGVRAQTVSAPQAEIEKAADEFGKLTQVAAVLGTQWGDEGKGKLVDILAQRYDVVARCQGGANAGHTIYNEKGQKFALHGVPSGVLNPKATCLVGNGVVVHLPSFFDELDKLQSQGVNTEGRVLVSDRAHLLFDLHREIDGLREEELAGGKIGTTKRGIGPAYASKVVRNGIRVGELRRPETFKEKLRVMYEDAKARFPGLNYTEEILSAEAARYVELGKRLEPYITDTVYYVNKAHAEKKKILIEGGQATLLDVDFGTYPFVTSSNPSIGGVIVGLGLAPQKLGAVIGVAKAYTTRVGAGPYPTELHDETGDRLRANGFEFGTTTGRPRRCGWLDMVALRFACDINGFTHINLTKLDVLSGFSEIKLGVGYRAPDGEVVPAFPADLELLEQIKVDYEVLPGWEEDISGMRKWSQLPKNAQAYVLRIEEIVGVEVKWIGVGPGRDAIITKE
ncbi:adenylosuccinate synthase [Klebsormidium nitens]|uniref:Adenylosuccinate synthetase, chloroplastic n=1 Tax=Klebsormidium nitens TaxID=105231 RepID=A0A1Y1IEE3_KLENI|nr:adenylosuccinate synthase [Klebsormidium nitens]|eukprot:GAQ87471.1 adenylosuccinate synthase [Klebsormidium nitens]